MVSNRSVQSILDKAIEGRRISSQDALQLFQGCHDLASLGKAADLVCRRMHPEPYRTYNIDRNINYTNICAAVCHFCAFYRKPQDADAYVLDLETIYSKMEETVQLGGDQILLQGGMHPTLKLEWYEAMLRALRSRFPQVNLHAFSPPEIWHFHRLNRLPLREVLVRLKEAGLGSLPGGGGEILVDRVRKELTVYKCMTDEWLEVHRVWHSLGGRSSATMMFGHVESLAERVETLERLRDLQEETGGFTAFICWTFQPQHTSLEKLPPTGAFEYLRTQAIARLYLDNFQNIQSSWVTQGLKTGQMGLCFGANDMGSLMIEENVVSSAGTVHHLTLEQIRSAIREIGFEPRQRNVFYQLIDPPSFANSSNGQYRPSIPLAVR
jgi:cyclic dehypoxanthinyl futalosine synthase